MIFLRHALTEMGSGVCYGQLDVGLGPDADAEMAAALAQVPSTRSSLYASDLTRCRLLAERFAARDAMAPIYDKRLREYHFGAWEGRRWNDIPRSESEPWIADLWRVAPPGGETFSALYDRVKAALEVVEDDALIVAHAGVIRAARMILLGDSFEKVFAEKVPHCVPINLARPTT